MKLPVISTLIPTYQRPVMLERAVKSVLSQTYPHLRVCVFDNCSNDETENVIKRIQRNDSRVYYHCHGKNIGAGANFIYALGTVETEYFTFLSDDDFLLPSFFETAVRQAMNNPEVGFVSLGCRIERDGKLIRPSSIAKIIKGYHEPPKALTFLLSHWSILTWTSIMFNKTVLEKVGFPLQEPCICNDLEFLLRVAASHPVIILEEEGAVFTDHQTSITSQSQLKYVWPCYPQVINCIIETYDLPPDICQEIKRLLNVRFQKRLAFCFLSALFRNEWDEAQKALNIFKTCGSKHHFLALYSLMSVSGLFPRLIHPLLSLFMRKKHYIVHLMDKLQSSESC